MKIWEVWVCLMTAVVLGVMGAGSSLESADLAWLLIHESPASQPQTGAQVSVRRITPKSVFLAPTFTSCSEGYRQDSLGRCVKVVKVNPSAQWDFFLQKLNSMYGPPEPNNKPNPGPFRLPIPLQTEPPTTTTIRTTMSFGTELPVASTVTEQPTTLSTTVLSTTTEEQTTEPPFLIVVANTTDSPLASSTLVTEQTPTYPPSTTTTASETATSDETTTSVCDDCDTPTTIIMTTPSPPVSLPSRTTIVFPESNRNKRPASPIVRFPESSAQQTPYWWPNSWEHRLWQPQQSYYPPRQTVYHGHREARPAWQQ